MTKWTTTHLLHGGDYNPDQWLNYPEVLKADWQLMKQAGVNTVTVGIFSWTALEPTEGEYHWRWLDDVFDQAEQNGISIILATPSGAKPAWLAQAYPEVLRVDEYDHRLHFGERHNHCFTSPVYRRYVAKIDGLLAKRYGQRKNLILWHISNEFGGECHCDLCQAAFRQWLKTQYASLDGLNDAWYTGFWGHHFDNWDEIHSPTPLGDTTLLGLTADWRRFVTAQTIDFHDAEVAAIRQYSDKPQTTNFMADTEDLEPFHGLDYAEFAKHVDVVSWDCYPTWENPAMTPAQLGSKIAMINDYFRSLKQQNFLIMESTPSLVNWHAFNRAKRPGQHRLAALQFLAQGADSVLYFQWRQSRGASEKFHGAVVAQDGCPDNRVFQDVAQVGHDLKALRGLAGVQREAARVAIVYDKQSHWNLDATQAFAQSTKKYWQTLQQQYDYFWERDIPVDIVGVEADLSRYAVVVDMMHYAMPQSFADKLRAYVQAGGVLIGGYISALVDHHDLAYTGDFMLADLYGVDRKEIDTLYPSMQNGVVIGDHTYPIYDYAEVLALNGGQALGHFTQDFYAGAPAIVTHAFGQGHTYYVGGRGDAALLANVYDEALAGLILKQQTVIASRPLVSVQMRRTQTHDVALVMNFSDSVQNVQVLQDGIDLLSAKAVTAGEIQLPAYGVMAIQLSNQ